jgi:DNA-binding response OmpR family regulator
MANILVVEDDRNTFQLINVRLRHSGHRLIWAHHGGQALDMAREHQPGVILLDVMMPVLDGFSALRQLKADPQTRAIPVIMVTVRGSDADIAAGSAGAAAYMVKPFDFKELLAHIDAALDSTQLREPAML